MADQTNNISIQITDAVATTIEPKIVAIADASDIAATSLDRLQAALNGIGSGGNALDGLSKSFNSIPSAANKVTNALDTLENKVITSAASIDGYAASITALGVALTTVLPTIQAYITTINQATAANAAFQSGSNLTAKVVTNVANATAGGVGGTRAFSSAISVAEGRTLGLNRAAGSFLATLVGGSPIIAAAFEVFGAVALLAVLVEIAQAIGNVVEAYGKMSIASRDAALEQIDNGNRVIQVQRTLLSVSTLAGLLSGSGLGQKTVAVEQTADLVKQLDYQKQINAALDAANDAGLQGEALARQRVEDKKQDAKFDADAITALRERQVLLKQQLDATKTIRVGGATNFGSGAAQSASQTFSAPVITDQKQRDDLTKQYQSAADAIARFNTEENVALINTEALKKKEPLAGLKDEAKAAAIEIRAIADGLAKLKQGSSFLDPSKELAYYKQQQALVANGPLRNNTNVKDTIDRGLGSAQQGVDRQNDTVKTTIDGLQAQASAIGKYTDAQKVQLKLDEQVIAFQKQHITLQPQELSILKDYDTQLAQSAKYQSALTSAYEQATNPAREFQAVQIAIQQLIKEDPANIDKYNAALNVAKQTYTDSLNPLNATIRALQDQQASLELYGGALTAFNQRQAIEIGLRQKGYELTVDGKKAFDEYFSSLERAKQVQSDVNQLYDQNAGAINKLVDSYKALEIAKNKGIINDKQEKNGALQLELEYAKLQARMGNTSALVTWEAAAGKFLSGYKGIISGVDDLYANLTDTIGNGLSNAIGRALAYGENLGDALKDVARQALSELISGIIKLGLQWVIQATIGKALAAVATASSIAQAAALATAWAGPAFLASVATLGGADAIGGAALATGLAAAIAGGAAAGAATSAASGAIEGADELSGSGGYATGSNFVTGPGTPTSDSIPAWLSKGEAVITAANASKGNNRSAIAAINSGIDITSAQANASVGTSNNPQRIVIEDHTSGAKISMVGVTHDEVRFIAQDVADTTVKQKAPSVVAADMQNPNGRTSKTLKRNYSVRDRRTG